MVFNLEKRGGRVAGSSLVRVRLGSGGWEIDTFLVGQMVTRGAFVEVDFESGT